MRTTVMTTGLVAGCFALAGCGLTATEAGELRTALLIGEFGNADGDKNHVLCLDSADQAVSVSFPGGILKDPNGDLNPQTSVNLSNQAATHRR